MEENDDDTLFRLVDGMIQGRNEFLNDQTIRGLPFATRSNVVTQYMNNEILLLSFLTRVYLNSRQTQNAVITFNLPNNFMNPVEIVPSAQQISSSLQDSSNVSGNCAICQEAVSSGGCRIRQCGHSFHRSCILNWFSMSVRCPVCRHDIREENLVTQTSSDASETLSLPEDQ